MPYAQTWTAIWLVVAMIFPLGAVADAKEEVSTFLTQDHKLQEQLELRDAQAGFVGESGTILAIEPSGRWRMARFVNEQVNEPHQQGHLTQEELILLAKAFVVQQFSTFPSRFGSHPKVNPHIRTLRFGKRETTLVLNAGEPTISAASVGDDERTARRFMALWQTIQNLLQVKQ